MRIVFLGTPVFSVASLAAILHVGHEVVCVYSQPTARRGRGRILAPTPVQAFAEARGLPVRTPASLRDAREVEAFRALAADAGVVVAFGQILSTDILEAPRLGAFNLHASLLPRWRGAAPIQRAIMAGDSVTGAAVMRMTAGLDEGPVLSAVETSIGPLETAGSLHDRLAVKGAALLVETLSRIERGEAGETAQPPQGATYAKKISKKETRLVWDVDAAVVDRKIRGLSPFPGAWLMAPSDRGPIRIKALLSQVEPRSGPPGETLEEGLLVACRVGAVRILRAQREGRAPQDADEFARGFPIRRGTRLS